MRKPHVLKSSGFTGDTGVHRKPKGSTLAENCSACDRLWREITEISYRNFRQEERLRRLRLGRILI
jgi:hypothetical protein